MSKANDFAVEGKVSAIRATMSGLSSAFKEKLRLPLPIATDTVAERKPVQPPSPSLSDPDSPEKSRRSQSAFQVTHPKRSYSEEDEDSRQEGSLSQSRDDDFKPSPRFNLSTGGSDYVSPYVAFGGNPEPPADSFRGLHIPNQYEFTLVRSKLEEQLQDKDHLLTELKSNERKLELRLAEALQSLSHSESSLQQSQQRVKSLQVELDRLSSRSEVSTLQRRLSDLERENKEMRKSGELKEEECAGLRGRIGTMERRVKSLEEELAAVREESREIERDWRVMKEKKVILEENVASLKKGRAESSGRLRSAEVEDLRAQLDHMRLENQHLSNQLHSHIGSTENSQRHALKPRNARKSASPGLKHRDRSQSHEKPTSPKESYTRDMIRKDKSHHSRHQLVRDLMKLLDLEQPEELLPCVETLCKHHKQNSQVADFIQRLQAIVTACSPPAAFPEPPSLPQMWKWVRRLVEEYMNLRKTPEVLERVMAVLRIRNSGDVVKTVESLVGDYERLHLGLSHMKAKLRLPLSADVSTVTQELEARLGA